MDDICLTIDQVIQICSNAHLSDGTLCFDAYGTNDIRGKTFLFLARKGILIEEAERIINALTINDFVEGPVDNYIAERTHKLWIFLKKYKNMKIYIKLLIYNKRRNVAVISMHD